MQRPNPDVPPYLSWCLIARNCAATVEYTLKSLRARTPDAEIVVVDTCSRDDSGLDVFFSRSAVSTDVLDAELESRLAGVGLKFLFVDFHAKVDEKPAVRIRVRLEDGGEILPGLGEEAAERAARALEVETFEMFERGASTIEICQRYADTWVQYKGPRGDWTEDMAWFDDAAAARNKSFELAKGVWKGWIDTDDVIPSAAETERLLKMNGRFRPAAADPKHVTEKIDAPDGGTLPTIEHILKFIETNQPHVQCLNAPYLYRMDAEGVGTAEEWQDRERIIRTIADKPWHWREESHEVLVPVSPRHQSQPGYLAHVLWVHLKRHSPAAMEYAVKRHWDVLVKKYEAGERNSRNCLYLQDYARLLAPQRRAEFINAGYESATVPIDRYRILLAAARMHAEQGFFQDALEAAAGAMLHKPDLPDAYFVAGNICRDAGDHARSARFYSDGAKKRHAQFESEVPPRDHLTRYKTLAALELREHARFLMLKHAHDMAIAMFDEAHKLMLEVCRSDATPKADLPEAVALADLMAYDRDGYRAVLALHEAWRYLIRNDETQKALEVRKLIPHNYQDHPLAVGMERWGVKVHRHLTDEKAYVDFYNDDAATGMVFTEQLGDAPLEGLQARAGMAATWLAMASGSLQDAGGSPHFRFIPGGPTGADDTISVISSNRSQMAMESIRDAKQKMRVLEVGVLDGSTAIPILRAAHQNIEEYVGLDIHEAALEEFRRRVELHVPEALAKIRTVQGMHIAEVLPGEKFDAVVLLEVIEHVPDMVKTIKGLLAMVAPGGRLFMSTPWGSYDKGAPSNLENRDPRGHVRSIMPRDFVEACEAAGGRVVDLQTNFGVYGLNASIGIAVEPDLRPTSTKPRKLTFAVAAALWDWNATTVLNQGMGASESTIVYLAREYARQGRDVEVYGPLPKDLFVEAEVNEGVKYWPREQSRFIDPKSTVVVSRAPFYGTKLDEVTDTKLDRILWLQDTVYDDLTPEVAAGYRKIVCVSDWHKEFTAKHLGVPINKIEAIHNFVIPGLFRREPKPPREKHHFMSVSSPDRGLIDLLKIWPKILARWPDATLDVFYGWRGCRHLASIGQAGWVRAYRNTRQQYEALRYQKGVQVHEMVSHALLINQMHRCSAWIYPTWFLETCLHGDSQVSVPGDHRRGTPVRVAIKDLVGKTNFPIYCFDEGERRFRIGTAKRCWETRVADELVALTLDDGQVLRCTPEHKLLTFDDEWIEAGAVAIGQRLRGLHFRYDVMIKDAGGTWEKESRLVAEWKIGRPLAANEHVDHVDETRLDNSPDALAVLTASEHARKTHAGKELTKAQRARLGAWTKIWAKENPDAVSARATKAGLTRWKKYQALPEKERDRLERKRVAKRAATIAEKCANDPIYRDRLAAQRAENGRRSMAKLHAKRREQPQNHKVVKVERVAGAPVYDMEVETFHNFVADGVVVHNCCSTALEMRAAGVVPVCTPLAALVETAASPHSRFVTRNATEDWSSKDPAAFDAYADQIVEATAQAIEVDESERARMTEEVFDKFSITVAMSKWDRLLNGDE